MQSFQVNSKRGRVLQGAAADASCHCGLKQATCGAVAKGGASRQVKPGAVSAKSTGRPNPSVKGTSCGKPQAAPYVER